VCRDGRDAVDNRSVVTDGGVDRQDCFHVRHDGLGAVEDRRVVGDDGAETQDRLHVRLGGLDVVDDRPVVSVRVQVHPQQSPRCVRREGLAALC